MERKLFVLDTYVVLQDARCIENFGLNDVIIPIAVLEEIDKFKRGNEDIHFQARKFMRSLVSLTRQPDSSKSCWPGRLCR